MCLARAKTDSDRGKFPDHAMMQWTVVMGKRLPVLVLLLAAIIGVFLVWLSTIFRRAYDASMASSQVVATHLAACDYLILVVEDSLPWPQDEAMFRSGFEAAVARGDVIDPGVDVLKYVSYGGSRVALSEDLTVCDEKFPIQSTFLSCEQRTIYGGQSLLEAIRKHSSYFD